MPPRKKTTSAPSKASAKYFTFRLSLNGLAGIALVAFCLFLFMFFLGMWAGETIVSPCPPAVLEQVAHPITKIKTRLATQPVAIRPVRQPEIPVSLPQPETTVTRPEEPAPSLSSPIYVQPRERKKRISFDEPSLYHNP